MDLLLHLAKTTSKNQYNNDNTGGAIRSFFMPFFANSSDRTISHIKDERRKSPGENNEKPGAIGAKLREKKKNRKTILRMTARDRKGPSCQ